MKENEKKDQQKTLLQLDMRDINNDKLLKELNLVRAYTERLNYKNNKDIFLGIRNNRLTFYYLGRELMTIKFNSKKSFSIITRKEFSSNQKLNQDFKNIIYNIPLEKNLNNNKISNIIDKKYISYSSHRYIITIDEIRKNYSLKNMCEYLLKNLKNLLDEYYGHEIKKELPVQGLYTTKYNNIKDDLYIIDMEFTLPDKFKKEVGNANLQGRFDMIAIKNDNGQPKLVFIELKVDKKACIGKNSKSKGSGINNHIEDMEIFLEEYNKNGLLKEVIQKNIERILEIKKSFKLDGFRENPDFTLNDEAFQSPEYWILMDMKDGSSVSSVDDIESLIKNIDGPLIKKMQNAKLKFYKGDIDKKYLEEL